MAGITQHIGRASSIATGTITGMEIREFELVMETEESRRGVFRRIVRWHYPELDENTQKLVTDMLTTENPPVIQEKAEFLKKLAELVTLCQKIIEE